jgi:hypothetical protein
VEEYLLKQKELNVYAHTEADKIATELISKCVGKTTNYLRKRTLDTILLSVQVLPRNYLYQ